MIWATRYWKRQLLRTATELRKMQKQSRWPDASYARLENHVMIAFYAVRKLLYAFQPMLTIEKRTTVQVTKFPYRGNRFLSLEWPELDEHFDLRKPTQETRGIEFICNQVIHSYVFTPWFDAGDRLRGFFFVSDHEKENGVFRLEIDATIQLFERIAAEEGKWRMRFGPEKNEHVM